MTAMKLKIYIETSVVSYLTAPLSKDARKTVFHAATRDWFSECAPDFDLYTSQLVAGEATAGNRERAAARLARLASWPQLLISDAARALAPRLLRRANLPEDSLADALHIAIAALNGMDYLLTWNMRHIANENVRQRVRAVLAEEGVRCPALSTPLEFLD